MLDPPMFGWNDATASRAEIWSFASMNRSSLCADVSVSWLCPTRNIARPSCVTLRVSAIAIALQRSSVTTLRRHWHQSRGYIWMLLLNVNMSYYCTISIVQSVLQMTLTINDIPYVNKRLAWTVLWNSVIAPDLDKINLIKELLSVKFHKGQISLFCESGVDFMIWFLCTS